MFVFILDARDVEAFRTVALVFAFTTAATDVVAVVKLDNVASEPAVKVASVRLRVA